MGQPPPRMLWTPSWGQFQQWRRAPRAFVAQSAQCLARRSEQPLL